MMTTCFFLLFLAFYLWYRAATPAKATPAAYQVPTLPHARSARLAGTALLLLVASLLVWQLGWMTGLSTWLVGLMGVGSLVVVLAPLRYLRLPVVVALYAVFLTLELAL